MREDMTTTANEEEKRIKEALRSTILNSGVSEDAILKLAVEGKIGWKRCQELLETFRDLMGLSQ